MAKNNFRTSTLQFVNFDFNLVLEDKSDGSTVFHSHGKTEIPLKILTIMEKAQKEIINELKKGV